MQVYKIRPRGFAANCFLITADGKHAVAIDPAQPRVKDEAEALGLKVEFVLLTHGHFDHIGGCAALQALGAKIGCLEAEKPLALYNNLGEEFGDPVPPFTVDFTFQGGEKLQLCGITLEVLATAGHTRGGACYMAENAIFTGDTLFAGDVGRTDLPTGSDEELASSLKALCALEGDYTVYAGHGAESQLSYEKAHNPYLCNL